MQILTFDEILTKICDDFDTLISPKKIARTNTNILYLVFKAISKGFEIINNVCVVLSNKFDPASCSEEDLQSVADLVGTERLKGSATGLLINITNKSNENVILLAGTYTYKYDDDISFIGTVLSDTEISALNTLSLIFMSDSIGSYAITEQSDIKASVTADVVISSDLSFSCDDNASLLGSEEESDIDFRKRILNTTNRQNTLVELETEIKNLPYIFDCKVKYNPTDNAIDVDGASLSPYKMFIYCSGDIRNEIAEVVAKYSFYQTQEDSTTTHETLTYVNEVFANGGCEIIVNYFKKVNFNVDVRYIADTNFLSASSAREQITSVLLKNYRSQLHIDFIREADIYNVIEALDIAGLTLLSVDLKYNNEAVDYIAVPPSCLVYLENVNVVSSEG